MQDTFTFSNDVASASSLDLENVTLDQLVSPRLLDQLDFLRMHFSTAIPSPHLLDASGCIIADSSPSLIDYQFQYLRDVLTKNLVFLAQITPGKSLEFLYCSFLPSNLNHVEVPLYKQLEQLR
jgi:hypothetical protein